MFRYLLESKKYLESKIEFFKKVIQPHSPQIKAFIMPPDSAMQINFQEIKYFFSDQSECKRYDSYFKDKAYFVSEEDKDFFGKNYKKYIVIDFDFNAFGQNSEDQEINFYDFLQDFYTSILNIQRIYLGVTTLTKEEKKYYLADINKNESNLSNPHDLKTDIMFEFSKMIYILEKNDENKKIMICMDGYDGCYFFHQENISILNKLKSDFLSEFYRLVLFNPNIQSKIAYSILGGQIDLLQNQFTHLSLKTYDQSDRDVVKYFHYEEHVLKDILCTHSIVDTEKYLSVLKQNYAAEYDGVYLYNHYVVNLFISGMLMLSTQEYQKKYIWFENFLASLSDDYGSPLERILDIHLKEKVKDQALLALHLKELSNPLVVLVNFSKTFNFFDENFDDKYWLIRYLHHFGLLSVKNIKDPITEKEYQLIKPANVYSLSLLANLKNYDNFFINKNDSWQIRLSNVIYPSYFDFMVPKLTTEELDLLALFTIFNVKSIPSAVRAKLDPSHSLQDLVRKIRGLNKQYPEKQPLIIYIKKNGKLRLHSALIHYMRNQFILNKSTKEQEFFFYQAIKKCFTLNMAFYTEVTESPHSFFSIINLIDEAVFYIRYIIRKYDLHPILLCNSNDLMIRFAEQLTQLYGVNQKWALPSSQYDMNHLNTVYKRHIIIANNISLSLLSADLDSIDSVNFELARKKYIEVLWLTQIMGNPHQFVYDNLYARLRVHLLNLYFCYLSGYPQKVQAEIKKIEIELDVIQNKTLQSFIIATEKLQQQASDNPNVQCIEINSYSKEYLYFINHPRFKNIIFLLLELCQQSNKITPLYRFIAFVFEQEHLSLLDKASWLGMDYSTIPVPKYISFEKYIKNSGFISDDGGVCCGVGYAGGSEILSKNIDEYNKNCILTFYTPLELIRDDLQKRENRWIEFPYLDEPKKNLYTFFHRIEVLQQPECYPHLFSNQTLGQHSLEAIEKVMAQILKKFDGIQLLAEFMGMYINHPGFENYSLHNYCVSLIDSATCSLTHEITMSISSKNHDINIGYIPETNTFIFINYGGAQKINSKDKKNLIRILEKKILSAFAHVSTSELTTRIYVTKFAAKHDTTLKQTFKKWQDVTEKNYRHFLISVINNDYESIKESFLVDGNDFDLQMNQDGIKALMLAIYLSQHHIVKFFLNMQAFKLTHENFGDCLALISTNKKYKDTTNLLLRKLLSDYIFIIKNKNALCSPTSYHINLFTEKNNKLKEKISNQNQFNIVTLLIKVLDKECEFNALNIYNDEIKANKTFSLVFDILNARESLDHSEKRNFKRPSGFY